MKKDTLHESLSSISSFAGRKRFCDKHFDVIKGGSSRITYDFGDGNVLKLARNAKGIPQNDTESDFGLAQMHADILNPPLDVCEEGTWILTPKLEPVKKRDIEDYLGVSLSDLRSYLGANERLRDGYPASTSACTKLDDNEICDDIKNLISNTDLISADFYRPSSWGRESLTGAIKIIDWGLDKQTLRQHYRPSTGPGF